jgi:EmrB/QacA subfamily drug resistance transporter
MKSGQAQPPGEPLSESRSASEAAGDRLAPGTIVALTAMSLAVFAIAIDSTALSVALPAIERDFSVDVSSVQWVINAYGLVFGVLIVAGGRLADTLGRRGTFLVGAGLFAVFSVLGAAAQDAAWLIAARGLMGVGAALMWPATLGMTYAALPPRRAGLAGGLILGVAGIGNALGPLIGGALTDAASWRWVLFLNLPVALVAAVTTWLKIDQPRPGGGRERVDTSGIVALSSGCFALLIALDEGTSLGFGDWRVIVLLAVFVVAVATFPWLERRQGACALIPPDVVRSRQFAAACVAIPLLAAGFFASLLYLPQYTQKLLGYSPLRAGVALLPLMLVYGVVSFVAGTLYNRLGAKLTTAAGAGLMASGLLLLSLIPGGSSYGGLVVGMVVFGAGLGLFLSSATTAGVTALDPSRASLGGGVLHMLHLTGGSIGLGLTTAVFTSSFHSASRSAVGAGTVTRHQEHVVNGLLAGATSAPQLAQRHPGSELERVARDAFLSGMHSGFRVAAALAALGCLVAIGFIGGRPRLPARRRTPVRELAD